MKYSCSPPRSASAETRRNHRRSGSSHRSERDEHAVTERCLIEPILTTQPQQHWNVACRAFAKPICALCDRRPGAAPHLSSLYNPRLTRKPVSPSVKLKKSPCRSRSEIMGPLQQHCALCASPTKISRAREVTIPLDQSWSGAERRDGVFVQGPHRVAYRCRMVSISKSTSQDDGQCGPLDVTPGPRPLGQSR